MSKAKQCSRTSAGHWLCCSSYSDVISYRGLFGSPRAQNSPDLPQFLCHYTIQTLLNCNIPNGNLKFHSSCLDSPIFHSSAEKKQCFLIGDGGLKGIWQGYRSGHRAFSIVATCSSCVTASAYDSPSTKHTMFRETTHQAGHAGTNERFANTQEAEICWLEMYKTPELHRRGDS